MMPEAPPQPIIDAVCTRCGISFKTPMKTAPGNGGIHPEKPSLIPAVAASLCPRCRRRMHK